MQLKHEEIIVLRELAKLYAETAAKPIWEQKKKLWIALNTGRMQRPMLLMDQMPWHELDTDGFLQNKVQHTYWRRVESAIRRDLYKAIRMPADMVLSPYILLPRSVGNSGFGIQTQEERSVLDEQNSVVGHKYHNQFTCMEDVEKIQMPKLTWDREAEAEIILQAQEIFDGIIPFKLVGETMHLGAWDWISQWMGVEECYYALVDQPEMLHAMMERITTGLIGLIDEMNVHGLFDSYSQLCHCSHTFSGNEPEKDFPKSSDVWAFGLAQLFSSASPEVTEEFELPYMTRIFEKFGSIYYGCCERLDDRLDVIAKLPKLRKVSCSPWSDREQFAQALPNNLIMSNKPSPALIATETVDWDAVRADIRRTVAAAKAGGVGLELILKDISTVRYQPERLSRWAEIALEEVER